ncbi:MAG: hypothetical protein U5N53_27910 [Mycobacterium sp.]|nr:hypothetical protein [Mycobacterium sp.]
MRTEAISWSGMASMAPVTASLSASPMLPVPVSTTPSTRSATLP